jgi:hypothetical protein
MRITLRLIYLDTGSIQVGFRSATGNSSKRPRLTSPPQAQTRLKGRTVTSIANRRAWPGITWIAAAAVRAGLGLIAVGTCRAALAAEAPGAEPEEPIVQVVVTGTRLGG